MCQVQGLSHQEITSCLGISRAQYDAILIMLWLAAWALVCRARIAVITRIRFG